MSAQPALWVLGAGGHAKVVIAAAEAAGFRIAGLLDDAASLQGSTLMGHTITHGTAALDGVGLAIIAIGDNAARMRVARTHVGASWATVVDPRAVLHATVKLGAGTVAFAGAIVQPDTVIGRHVVLNTSCSVDHDCTIGDAVHVGPGSHVAGGVTIEEGAFLGIGSAVVPGRRIGAWSVVGAGATVTEDVPPRTVVIGTPARPLSHRDARGAG